MKKFVVGCWIAVMCWQGWAQEPVSLSNGTVEVVVMPEHGGKIASVKLLDTPDGYEFVSRTEVPYRPRNYAMPFDRTELDGIDECFPSVGAAMYPMGPWQRIAVPDHGELVSVPWQVEPVGDTLVCRVGGVRFPYTMQRTIRLDENKVVLDYVVTNNSSEEFYWLYAMHPLMVAYKDSQVIVPGEPIVNLGHSAEEYLGTAGSDFTWPHASTGVDASIVPDVSSQRYAKMLLDQLPEQWTALRHPDGYAIRWDWQAEDPWDCVGVWINAGVVPAGFLQVAIEPTNAPYEGLDEAYHHDKDRLRPIPGYGRVEWSITLTLSAPDTNNE